MKPFQLFAIRWAKNKSFRKQRNTWSSFFSLFRVFINWLKDIWLWNISENKNEKKHRRQEAERPKMCGHTYKITKFRTRSYAIASEPLFVCEIWLLGDTSERNTLIKWILVLHIDCQFLCMLFLCAYFRVRAHYPLGHSIAADMKNYIICWHMLSFTVVAISVLVNRVKKEKKKIPISWFIFNTWSNFWSTFH